MPDRTTLSVNLEDWLQRIEDKLDRQNTKIDTQWLRSDEVHRELQTALNMHIVDDQKRLTTLEQHATDMDKTMNQRTWQGAIALVLAVVAQMFGVKLPS